MSTLEPELELREKKIDNSVASGLHANISLNNCLIINKEIDRKIVCIDMYQGFAEKLEKSSQGLESIPKFLKIVFQIIEECMHEEHICWSQDGRAILIKNPKEFAEDLLPIYFKHSNYSSFVRQVTYLSLTYNSSSYSSTSIASERRRNIPVITPSPIICS